MKNKIRILSVIIALLTLISVFSLSVSATDVVSPNPDTGEVVEPNNPDTDWDYTDPDTDGDYTDPDADGGYTDPDMGGDTTDTDMGGDNYDNTTVTPDTSGSQTGGYVTDDSGFYYYDEDSMASSIDDAAGSVSDVTDLYDTSDVDESALKETKWDDITLDTSKTTSDVMDFSAIKQNTEDDDDSQWILYAGYILIALAVVGILYFIIATATYKKKLKKLNQRQRRYDSHRSRDDYGDSAEYPTAREYNRRTSHKRYAADGMSYSERKRLKADTAEINLPSQYRARR